jgi:hypothetical protein
MPRNKRSEYSAAKAHQGEIVRKRSWQQAVFIAGLVGCVLVAAVTAFFWQ